MCWFALQNRNTCAAKKKKNGEENSAQTDQHLLPTMREKMFQRQKFTITLLLGFLLISSEWSLLSKQCFVCSWCCDKVNARQLVGVCFLVCFFPCACVSPEPGRARFSCLTKSTGSAAHNEAHRCCFREEQKHTKRKSRDSDYCTCTHVMTTAEC